MPCYWGLGVVAKLPSILVDALEGNSMKIYSGCLALGLLCLFASGRNSEAAAFPTDATLMNQLYLALEDDHWSNVFSFLPPETAFTSGFVNSRLRSFARNTVLWRGYFRSAGLLPPTFLDAGSAVRADTYPLFLQAVELRRALLEILAEKVVRQSQWEEWQLEAETRQSEVRKKSICASVLASPILAVVHPICMRYLHMVYAIAEPVSREALLLRVLQEENHGKVLTWGRLAAARALQYRAREPEIRNILISWLSSSVISEVENLLPAEKKSRYKQQAAKVAAEVLHDQAMEEPLQGILRRLVLAGQVNLDVVPLLHSFIREADMLWGILKLYGQSFYGLEAFLAPQIHEPLVYCTLVEALTHTDFNNDPMHTNLVRALAPMASLPLVRQVLENRQQRITAPDVAEYGVSKALFLALRNRDRKARPWNPTERDRLIADLSRSKMTAGERLETLEVLWTHADEVEVREALITKGPLTGEYTPDHHVWEYYPYRAGTIRALLPFMDIDENLREVLLERWQKDDSWQVRPALIAGFLPYLRDPAYQLRVLDLLVKGIKKELPHINHSQIEDQQAALKAIAVAIAEPELARLAIAELATWAKNETCGVKAASIKALQGVSWRSPHGHLRHIAKTNPPLAAKELLLALLNDFADVRRAAILSLESLVAEELP